MGIGECAGEVVSSLGFDLTAAERLGFESQLAFEAGDFRRAIRANEKFDVENVLMTTLSISFNFGRDDA